MEISGLYQRQKQPWDDIVVIKGGAHKDPTHILYNAQPMDLQIAAIFKTGEDSVPHCYPQHGYHVRVRKIRMPSAKLGSYGIGVFSSFTLEPVISEYLSFRIAIKHGIKHNKR